MADVAQAAKRDRLEGVRWLEMAADTSGGSVCGKCGLRIEREDIPVTVFDMPRLRKAKLHAMCFQEAARINEAVA